MSHRARRNAAIARRFDSMAARSTIACVGLTTYIGWWFSNFVN